MTAKKEVKRQLEQSRRLQSGALAKNISEHIDIFTSELKTEQNEQGTKKSGRDC